MYLQMIWGSWGASIGDLMLPRVTNVGGALLVTVHVHEVHFRQKLALPCVDLMKKMIMTTLYTAK